MALNTAYRNKVRKSIKDRRQAKDDWWKFIRQAEADFPKSGFISSLKKYLYDHGYLTKEQMEAVQEMYRLKEQEDYRRREERARQERERKEWERRERGRREGDSYQRGYHNEDDFYRNSSYRGFDWEEYFFNGARGGGKSRRGPEDFTARPREQSAWEIFGLRPGASQKEIRTRYMELAKENHPDRGGDTAKMAKVNDAYDKLMGRS